MSNAHEAYLDRIESECLYGNAPETDTAQSPSASDEVRELRRSLDELRSDHEALHTAFLRMGDALSALRSDVRHLRAKTETYR